VNLCLLSLALILAAAAEDEVPPDESLIFGVRVVGGIAISERPVGSNLDPAQVEVDYDDEQDILTVVNNKGYPITFSFDLGRRSGTNTSHRLPVLKNIRPGGRLVIRFLPTSPEPMSYSYSWSWEMGTRRTRHRKRQTYQLPWPADQHFECTQGFDGGYSHRNQHAMDIVMPIGTPILAARGGTVVAITDGWGEGGADRKYFSEANYVTVMHTDGTYATYMHLLADSMVVSIGEEVETGQRLSSSGSSGFSARPHLHFVVKSALDGWTDRSWPVRFSVGDGEIILRPGKWYPSQPPQ
jgi:murein DD-endopeptidase MepM/ murein hydrolase activator NlpD